MASLVTVQGGGPVDIYAFSTPILSYSPITYDTNLSAQPRLFHQGTGAAVYESLQFWLTLSSGATVLLTKAVQLFEDAGLNYSRQIGPIYVRVGETLTLTVKSSNIADTDIMFSTLVINPSGLTEGDLDVSNLAVANDITNILNAIGDVPDNTEFAAAIATLVSDVDFNAAIANLFSDATFTNAINSLVSDVDFNAAIATLLTDADFNVAVNTILAAVGDIPNNAEFNAAVATLLGAIAAVAAGVAPEVWDYLLTSCTTPGTIGHRLYRDLVLGQLGDV